MANSKPLFEPLFGDDTELARDAWEHATSTDTVNCIAWTPWQSLPKINHDLYRRMARHIRERLTGCSAVPLDAPVKIGPLKVNATMCKTCGWSTYGLHAWGDVPCAKCAKITYEAFIEEKATITGGVHDALVVREDLWNDAYQCVLSNGIFFRVDGCFFRRTATRDKWLSDENGKLLDENKSLLVENAKLRREVERLERKTKK